MSHTEIINRLLVIAVAACLAAWILFLRGRRRPGYVLFAAGWVVTAALLALNGWLAEAPPLGNIYQVQVLLALCFLPAHLVLRVRGGGGWTACYFSFAAAIPLVGALFLEKNVGWRPMPALQSAWFVPHVAAYMVSYALSAIAFALTTVRLVRVGVYKEAPSEKHALAAWQTLRLAFPLMTFGLLSGALWADQAWAAYWSWDPKETWSLITWLLYAMYLHCQVRPSLCRFADSAQILAFIALLITFIVVNMVPRFASALHGYLTG